MLDDFDFESNANVEIVHDISRRILLWLPLLQVSVSVQWLMMVHIPLDQSSIYKSE